MAEKYFIVKNGLRVYADAIIDSSLTVAGNLTVQGDLNGNYLGFDSDFNAKSTTNLSEGSNLYYTQVRVDSAFDARLATKSTGDVAEGSNLYYTVARVDSDIISKVDSAFITNLTPEYVRENATQTLTNKTLTSATIQTSLVIGADGVIYPQTNGGFSVNENTSLSSTDTVFNFAAVDSTGEVSLSIGIPNQYHHTLRTFGDVDSNEVILGFDGATTAFKISNNAGTSPIGSGTTLLKINKAGRVHITEPSDALSRTNAAVTLLGGLGVSKTIRATDVIASNNIQAVGGNIIGSVQGTVSDISNHTTDALAEGSTNLYYTNTRVRSALTAGGDLVYDSAAGRYSVTTYKDSDARNAISVNDGGGDGSLTYNSSTGVITYIGPSASEVRAHFSAGTGVSLVGGVIAIGQPVGTADSVEFGGGLYTGDVIIQGNLTVNGTQTSTSQANLSISNAYITVADSNAADDVDIGIVGQYSDDGGTTIKRTGFIRDASNGEWYVFDGLIQDELDSDPPPQTINVNGTGWSLPTWNFGKLRGQYLGFDSDFAAFSSNYVVYDSDFTAVNAGRYAIDTTAGPITVTLPPSPTTGDYVRLIDVGNWVNNNVTVARNGSTIEGYADDFLLDLGQSIIEFIYINTTWQVYSSIGQRGPAGQDGTNADSANTVSSGQAIAYAIALG